MSDIGEADLTGLSLPTVRLPWSGATGMFGPPGRGQRSAFVESVQTALSGHYYGGTIDGNAGIGTERALRRYLQDNRITGVTAPNLRTGTIEERNARLEQWARTHNLNFGGQLPPPLSGYEAGARRADAANFRMNDPTVSEFNRLMRDSGLIRPEGSLAHGIRNLFGPQVASQLRTGNPDHNTQLLTGLLQQPMARQHLERLLTQAGDAAYQRSTASGNYGFSPRDQHIMETAHQGISWLRSTGTTVAPTTTAHSFFEQRARGPVGPSVVEPGSHQSVGFTRPDPNLTITADGLDPM